MAMFYQCTITLLAAWFLRKAMEKLIVISGKRWKRLFLLFTCWLLLAMIIYIGDLGNILPTIFCYLLSVWVACEGSFWKKITIGLMFSGTIFAFNGLRDNYLLAPESRQFMSPQHTIFIAAIYTLLFVFLLYSGIRRYAPDKEYKLSDSMWRLLLLLTITPVGIILSVVILHSKIWYSLATENSASVYFALFCIALFSVIGLLWAIMVLAKQQKLEEQNLMAEINQSYYESMEEQHFAIRRLKHDLANHLSVLLVMPEQQRESYIRSLVEESAVTRSMQYCGDVTVNAVLSVKEEQMKRYGICLRTEMEISAALPFGKTDVCALYANVLDNAAEACRKIAEDRREIILKSKAQKGIFCLEITNPVGEDEMLTEADKRNAGGPSALKLPGRGRLPATSKSDRENHGLGLRSVKEIVERYHGAMELKTEKGRFEVFLYMPLEVGSNVI